MPKEYRTIQEVAGPLMLVRGVENVTYNELGEIELASGEKRLYDATPLLDYPAFQPLKDDSVFKNAKVEHGVVVWLDGEIDIAPETMYHDSYAYDEMPA